ncbi:MAG: universal stress protein [Thermodesulfovibrionales bacterium]|nr:universal stress protein [Thermodesulfovibrionales bacterium]
MYTKIFAAVNEHLNSEISARYALNFARACGAKLYICFIAEKGMSRSSFDRAEDAIKRLFIKAEEMDIQVESIIETGELVKEIHKIVRHEGIDIVFASTRREDIERRFYAGTIARSLSLALPCSVALVRVVHMGRIHPRNILVPIKAKIDHIKERAYFTAKMAESFGSKVFVFHATKPITKFFHGEIHLTPVEWEKRLPKDTSIFMEYLRKYQIEFEGRVLPGTTARSITIEAASKKHDLIIMGASERSLLSSIFKGNPVEELLRETPCDLIVLKPRHEDK